MSERPFYYESPFNPDQDPAMLATRNQLIDQLLDPAAALPTADVYPVLGDLLFRKDLVNKYPAGTLLPIEEAMRAEQDASLYLGQDDQIIGEVVLRPRPEYGENVLYGRQLSANTSTRPWLG